MIIDGGQLAALLVAHQGWYDCPKGNGDKRLGPLVGYAARYQDNDGKQTHFVGDTYLNCAVLERQPGILWEVVLRGLLPLLERYEVIQGAERVVFCGAPEGGKAIALLLACHFRFPESRYVFPEKRVLEVATAEAREATQFVWGRHQVEQGEDVVIVEDLCNNFSTTQEMIRLVEAEGAHVIAIAALANRSLTVDDWYTPENGGPIPVISILRKRIQQYRQDDPAVAEDVRAGNVVWKPKSEWRRLAEAMSVPVA